MVCRDGAAVPDDQRSIRTHFSSHFCLLSIPYFPMKPPEVILGKKSRRATRCVTMRTATLIAVLVMLLSLLVAGWAGTGVASDNDRRAVFYGGISGGGSRP